MHFSSSLLLLASAAQILASPLVSRDDTVSTQNLAADDVVVLGADGSASVMKIGDYEALQRRAEQANAETVRRAFADNKKARTARKADKAKRSCEESSEVQVLTDSTFLNWDVAMSPVLSAAGGATVISVSDGYTISNSLSVGASSTLTLLKDVLQVSYTVTYSETWTSSTTASCKSYSLLRKHPPFPC